jgi:hypothetical protein
MKCPWHSRMIGGHRGFVSHSSPIWHATLMCLQSILLRCLR